MAKQTKKQTKSTPIDANTKFYYPEDISPEISLNNPVACANSPEFYYQSCSGCHYEKQCVYEQKYKYRKIN